MRRAVAWPIGLLLTGVLVGGSAGADDGLPPEVVARLGKLELKREEVAAILAGAKAAPGKPEQLRNLIANELVRRALLKEAQDQGWEKKPDVARQLARAREQVLVNTWLQEHAKAPEGYPSDDEIAKAYEASKGSLVLPRQYRLSQIFIASPSGADKAEASKAQDRAKELAKKAAGKGADFAALAKEHSQEARSAAQGGDAGWVTEQTLLPELRDKVAGMKKNEVAGPIKSSQGWHVLRLTDLREQRTLTREEARGSLVAALRKQKEKETEQAYLRALTDKAGLLFNDSALEKLKGAAD